MLSKYNHYKEYEDKIFIYNSLSDMIEIMSTNKFDELIKNGNKIEDVLFSKLVKKDMLINNETSEFSKVMLRFNETIYARQLHIVLLTTTDCNFCCSYCYQDYKKLTLTSKFIKGFINFLKKNIKKYDSIYIEWFGGEPLLAKKNLVLLSTMIQEICKKNGVTYIGAITSNGYFLTEDVALELINCGIKFFQITIDGNEQEHNSLRKLKNGKGTYNEIIKNIIEIKKKIPQKKFFRIGIRNNVTKVNMRHSSYDFFKKELSDDHRFSYFQYPIKDWGGEKIDQLKDVLINNKKEANLIDTDFSSQFSKPLSRRLCYTTKKNGFSITPDLKVYKCHHFVGKYRIDNLNISNYIGEISEKGILYDNESISIEWNTSNVDKECKECAYLPNCLFDKCPLKPIKYTNICKKEMNLNIENKMNSIVNREVISW